MLNHAPLQTLPDSKRVLQRMLALKNLLREKSSAKKHAAGDLGIPPKTLTKSLLLATWNVREFGANAKAGPRLLESLHYIAEVIAAFDVVALQEVNEKLDDFEHVMRILGDDWAFVLTDVTLGPSGNRERSAIVYDRRKVRFEGFAGQVVLPKNVRVGKKKLELEEQLARTPLVLGLCAGDLRLTLCTTHIYYGKAKANDPRRRAEIEALAQFLAARGTSDQAWAPTTVLLGDFNIFDVTKDATAKALIDAGFYLPPQVARLEAGETRMHYDQIALLSPKYDVKRQTQRARAGVVDLFSKLFHVDDWKTYQQHFPEKERASAERAQKYFRNWRTFQLSDHRPRWIELPCDFSQQTLAKWMHQA